MNTQSEQLSGQSTAYIATNKDGSSFIYLHMPMRGKFIPKWFPIDTNFFPIDSDELREIYRRREYTFMERRTEGNQNNNNIQAGKRVNTPNPHHTKHEYPMNFLHSMNQFWFAIIKMRSGILIILSVM